MTDAVKKVSPDEILEGRLSVAEQHDLVRLESLIDTCIPGIDAAARALTEIRDRKLYRESHSSFADYVRHRFNKTERYANYLISEAKTKTTVLGLPDSENGKPGTIVPKIKEAVEKSQKARRALSNMTDAEIIEAGEIADSAKGGTFETNLASAAKIVKAKPKSVEPPEPEGDIDEFSSPPSVRQQVEAIIVQSSQAIKEIASSLAKAKKAIHDLRGPGYEILDGRKAMIAMDLDNAITSLRTACPHAVCEQCQGKPFGCRHCGNHGWITNSEAKSR